ncbi:GyrI-like domain-containing protein [uncultured Paludibaculum sp.]|uniref:GyrI-like domain-containing protein n=1 Tax=uncultured Paludibaculum sp. TaxID=1765020 RepID=UPI002AABC709|nr:GyrI-like domain-containing protein [uncultured Paludibaculum sp.]
MATATELEFAEVQVAAALAVQLSNRCVPDPASISAAIRAGFESLMNFVTRHGLSMNGHPRAIYTDYGAAGVSFTLALPVAAGPSEPVDEPSICVETLGAAKAYRFTHHGPYEKLALTYNQIAGFMKEQGWMQSEADWARYMPMWEEYQNDPDSTPASELVTHIYLPLA